MLILSTANPKKRISHAIINGAVQIKEEEVRGEKLSTISPPSCGANITKLMKFSFLVIVSVIKGKFFGVKGVMLEYRGIGIGRYAAAGALRSADSYLNKPKYYGRFLRNIYVGICRVDSFFLIKSKVAAVYVSDPSYMNGVYACLAANNCIPLYHNKYPYSLTRFYSKRLIRSSDYFHVYPSVGNDRKKRGKDILRNVLKKTENISYMQSVGFESKEFKQSEAVAVIYAHSFTDAQQGYGGDKDFLSMFEWLMFTLNKLRGKKIILKAHPGFFRSGYQTNVFAWDRVIFEELVDKIKLDSEVTIIDWPMRNSELLAKLNPECVLISHHSNALLEGAELGFKCICSASTPWEKYNLFNAWYNKSEYSKMLSNFGFLMENDLNKVYEYVSDLYTPSHSFFSKNGWRHIVEEKVGIPASDLSKKLDSLNEVPSDIIEEIICELADRICDVEL